MSASKILIVEDELIAAENLAKHLKRLGYAVAAIVESGEEAIAKAGASQPDLVLMDIMLQGEMDGVAASLAISKQFQIPTVYMTAYADDATVERAKVTEPYGYLLKPFEPQELRSTIEIALYKHQRDRQTQEAMAKEKQLNLLKSQMISMAYHDFRIPLTVILSSSQLIRQYSQKWPEEKKKKHFDRVESSVKNMTELLDEVLLYSYAESGKIPFNPTLLNLDYFCGALAEELQDGMGKQHKLSTKGDRNCSEACMDNKLLRRILTNLLSNAIKYSPEGSTVEFSWSCQGENVIFRVKDSGIGIPPEEQEHLFEPFRRFSNVGDIKGTGLGLATVKKYVDLHGGQISINSEVNVGTTFTIILPLKLELLPQERAESEGDGFIGYSNPKLFANLN